MGCLYHGVGVSWKGGKCLLSLCCMSQFPLLQNLDNEDTTSRIVVRISGVVFVKCAVDVSQCLGYCHSSCGHPLSTLVEPALVQGPEGPSSHFPLCSTPALVFAASLVVLGPPQDCLPVITLGSWGQSGASSWSGIHAFS